MRSWLALALCLLTTRALAQDPLADPGPVLQQPYQPRVWSDPYAASIVHLRSTRPSKFWPIALIAVGSLALTVGIAGVVAPEPDSSLSRLEGAAVLAAGAAGLGTGIWLHRRVKERRAEINDQVLRLQMARAAAIPPLAHTPRPLTPPPRNEPHQYASSSNAIPPGSGALALLLSGAAIGALSSAWLYLVATDLLDGSKLPPAISFAVGGAMVVTGGVLLDRARKKRTSSDGQHREPGRVDLSLAPLLIRW